MPLSTLPARSQHPAELGLRCCGDQKRRGAVSTSASEATTCRAW
jgi:hypothetical protein